MRIRVKALSTAPSRSELARKVAIAPGAGSTGIGPAAFSHGTTQTRMSRSEKIVSGIAIGVLMAGFATGMVGVSAAQSFHPQPRVTHIQNAADWRHQ